MKETEFEQLCHNLSEAFNDFADDLNKHQIVHAELVGTVSC